MDLEYAEYINQLVKYGEELEKIEREENEAKVFLKELGIGDQARDFVLFLKDEAKVKEVVAKLKMKAFW